MSDDIDVDDLPIPERMVDPSSGKVWRVFDVQVSLTVGVVHPEAETTLQDAPRFTYPMSTVIEKMRRDDLRDRAAQEEREDTADESFECDECGETFQSAGALGGHRSGSCGG